MTSKNSKKLLVPEAPILVPAGGKFFCLTTDGEFLSLNIKDALKIIQNQMPIICNAPHISAKLGLSDLHAYDVLELFAFIHPGKFTAPSPKGMAKILGLFEPSNPEDECLALKDIFKHLLLDLTAREKDEEQSNPAAIAAMMGLYNTDNNKGWPWAETVLAALNRLQSIPDKKEIRNALRIWEKLSEFTQVAPASPPSYHSVNIEETNNRLNEVLQKQKRSIRKEQSDYAEFISKAFMPPQSADNPNVILAEAGTGVGKTLGYLSSSTAWAEKNDATVWISTYTRNLQRQIDTELLDFYKDKKMKTSKVVTRKGRENYLCLLNLEDITHAPSIVSSAKNATALGLMLRWVAATEEGDLAGKDFPGWLSGIIGFRSLHSFADHRGECLYTVCPHFNRCFIEKSIRRAQTADIVIANHALVMNQVAINSGEEGGLPSHYIFDEGHHLFEAADSAFDLQLNGKEAEDLRRWLLGADNSRRNRARGIKKRLEDLITDNAEAMKAVDMIVEASHSLPGNAWRQRLAEGNPKGVTENFLHLCYQQIKSRNKEDDGFYSIETGREEPIEGFLNAAYALKLKLQDLREPISTLIKLLRKKINDEADELDTETRERINFTINSLTYRSETLISGWISMLDSLKNAAPDELVDWLELTRNEGKETDVGLYRRYVDPIKIFTEKLKPHLQGMAVTSATLRDISDLDNNGWNYALKRSGANTIFQPDLFSVASPFNYKEHTKVFVVTDINKNSLDEIASAYRELFLASQGGALGIFTAVQRLKAIHSRIIAPLEDEHLRLYSQHIDPLDISSLIDIFKEEENACLLGTDATRDGIDVPGRSLRLVVYDRVPWPKPNLLHKARRKYFGTGYDDMLTRFKLKQAYGRLIRQSDDKGVFVMLDNRLPTRLTSAFPEGVEVKRLGLKDVIAEVKEFLN